MEEMEQVIRIFPQKLRLLLQQAGTAWFQAEELRLRAGQPFLMTAQGSDWFLLSEGGRWMPVSGREKSDMDIYSAAYLVTPEDIRDTLEYMSRYSLYAFDEELRQGFLTVQGGHRVGVAGQAVIEGKRIKTLRNISFLNVRVARQVLGCADALMPRIYQKGSICSTLIISPPGGGKTTLLRDLIRQVSNGWERGIDWEKGDEEEKGVGRRKGDVEEKNGGQENGSGQKNLGGWKSDGNRENRDKQEERETEEKERPVIRVRGMTVGVVDERSELGACSQGIAQNDLGFRTDILDNCPKAEGIMMLIRSMAPQVVAVDEIGSREDLEAICYGKNCGCKLLATVHGSSLEDIRKKPVLQEFVREGVFERYIVLEGGRKPGTVKAVLDGEGRVLR